jgi:hypothetical protein
VAATFVRDSSKWDANSQPHSDRHTVCNAYSYADPKCHPHTHSHTYRNAKRDPNSTNESDSDLNTYTYLNASSKRNTEFNPKTYPDPET